MNEAPESGERETGPIGWRNWRAQISGLSATGEIEFAIYSDAHLTEGNFKLGAYTLINAVGSSGPIGNVQLGLVLRVADFLPDERLDYDWSRTDTTHYHGGGIAEEFAALRRAATYSRSSATAPPTTPRKAHAAATGCDSATSRTSTGASIESGRATGSTTRSGVSSESSRPMRTLSRARTG